MKRSTHLRGIAGLSILALALTACGGDGDSDSDGATEATTGGNAAAEPVTLSFAHSYATSHPHQTCGAELVKEKVEEAGVGLEIEIFPDSTLGGHAERFASVVSGDIDIDIQGPSEISQTFEPVASWTPPMPSTTRTTCSASSSPTPERSWVSRSSREAVPGSSLRGTSACGISPPTHR